MKAVLLFIENHQIDSIHRFLKPAVDGEPTRAATPFHHRTSSDDGADPALAGAAFGRPRLTVKVLSLSPLVLAPLPPSTDLVTGPVGM
ncbi:hypothetical protein FQA47_003475 [Oryzias melastigma]|uniref:Uncharacterized protein n=1 Tax=Oryzias melastigma TaxID=30732 RepID=A0A834BTF0_ORYME|nr:hypothetical protein FQA47_003475 [Oryzias melastigma]